VSGNISYGELSAILRRFQFKIEPRVLQKICRKFDVDRDGQISATEFLGVAINYYHI
jgi:Ca2+-binding EF-hand superfamily protein